jgi:hypothetical protein
VRSLLLLIIGCKPVEVDLDPPTPTSPTSSTGSTTGATGPTGTPGTTAPPTAAPELTGLSARLSDFAGSIVYVDWTQDQAAKVHAEFSFDAGIWLSSPDRDLPAGAHEELLLGIPYGSTATWRLVAENDFGTIASPDAEIEVAPVPPDMPIGQVTALDLTKCDPAPYVFVSVASSPTDFGSRWWTMFVDRLGRPVWGVKSDRSRVSMHPRIAKDGHSLFIDENSFWPTFDGGANSTIEQLYIDGTPIHTFHTPGEHHPFTDLPDGSVAYGAMIWPGYATEYLQIVHPDDSVDTLWDCAAWLQSEGIDDFCASNTLNYDDATGKFLFSFWSFESVIQIDGTTGAVDKRFGHLGGSYAFDPPNTAFWWQHGGYITDAGTFMTSSDLNTNGVETVVREYEIDDATQTLHEIWDFGVGEGVYGYEMGEAHRLANGNTLHNYGELARVREATPAKEVVWDIEWPSTAVGRSVSWTDLYSLAPAERP